MSKDCIVRYQVRMTKLQQLLNYRRPVTNYETMERSENFIQTFDTRRGFLTLWLRNHESTYTLPKATNQRPETKMLKHYMASRNNTSAMKEIPMNFYASKSDTKLLRHVINDIWLPAEIRWRHETAPTDVPDDLKLRACTIFTEASAMIISYRCMRHEAETPLSVCRDVKL